jgi:hypothetical protein
VARHIFQACPVWIYTQSNITNIIFTWVHNINNTEKKSFEQTLKIANISAIMFLMFGQGFSLTKYI